MLDIKLKIEVKRFCFLLLLMCFAQSVIGQIDNKGGVKLKPYVGLSSPTGDLKDFAKSGSVFGVSIDKYISNKFALGLDLNFQSNDYSNPFNFSNIDSPFSVTETESGKWNTTAFTFGPTYRMGTSKLNAEIYSKLGLLYIKSPDAYSIFDYSTGTKEIFNLPEQERTSFGVTSGIRLNYQVSKGLSLFFNPQYIYSSSEVEYCDCGVSGNSNPEEIVEAEPIKKSLNPSYFNVNAGLTFSLGGNKDKIETQTSINRNIPFCDIEFVELECNATSTVLQFTLIWQNYLPNYTMTVEVYDGTTLLNPSTSGQQPLSQNYGSVPFYVPISTSLIGTNLTVKFTIYDLNGNVVCPRPPLNFIVPQCSPQPPSCDFDIDLENVSCDGNTITYTATSTWSNLMVGSVVDLIVVDQSGNAISPLTVTPNSFPISINSANATGSLSNSITIPYSYNNSPIDIYLQFEDPTTGAINRCAFYDLFTPNCNNSTPTCDWDYDITCDNVTNSVKTDVSSTWSNVPNGSFLDFELINGNASVGGNIAFTSTPNSFPMTISGTGSTTNSLHISGYPAGNPFVFKMKITDPNGTLLCEQGIDEFIPECNFKTCAPREISAKCENGTVTVDFEVPYTNFNQFANLYVFADIYSSTGSLIQNLSTPLTGANGTASFSNISLPPQYAGTTITVLTRICKQGQPSKSCDCQKKLIIDIPICCETCFDLEVEHEPKPNQSIFQDFSVTGYIQISPTKINKVIAQLQSIGFDNNGNVVIPTNFEFRKGSYMYTTSLSTGSQSNLIGSLTGDRSNLLSHTFSNPTSVVNFNFLIDNYINKRIVHYKIKLTIFKDDGTFCEQIIQYNR